MAGGTSGKTVKSSRSSRESWAGVGVDLRTGAGLRTNGTRAGLFNPGLAFKGMLEPSEEGWRSSRGGGSVERGGGEEVGGVF